MRKLIKNVTVITPADEPLFGCIGVNGKYIDYIGKEIPEGYDEIIDGKNGIAIPGFVNTHTHIPMTLFRGYAEDMPLQEWLFNNIFPAEDKLDSNAVRQASYLAIAEMLAGGTTSFSEMYYFCDDIAAVVDETGVKSNISRSITAFAETDPSKIIGIKEMNDLYRNRNNTADGRVMIDFSIHAEYTNTAEMCTAIADIAKENDAILQIHVSETKTEHEECIGRHGLTPTAFLEKCGCFDTPLVAAHCVWLTDDDMKIFAKHNATVAHNPSSNLKLGSGIARVMDMIKAGINVGIGTDGCASNNNTDMFTEMHLASLLQKGANYDPSLLPARTVLDMATINGAKAQRRFDTGSLEVGKRADIAIVSTDKPHMCPVYNPVVALVQSARAADVTMTMVDGKVLYKDGEYTTIDIEKVKYETEKVISEKYR